jgi:outer membrane protein OmpA-like peptidoglycan-associated protein
MSKGVTILFSILLISMSSCVGQKKVVPFGTDSKKAFILFGEALLEHDIQNDDEALDILKKALDKDPNYIDALNLTGEILADKKDYIGAKEAYHKILRISPDYLYALDDLSQIHFDIDEYDECLRLLNRMLPLVGVSDKRAEIQRRIASAEFAKYAVAHPIPFKPVNLGSLINTVEEEYFPGLSTDEDVLYFTRRDGRVNIYAQNEDIYVSVKKESEWMKAQSLGEPVNTVENEGAFSASPDGKYLFFTSCSRPGGVGRCDIWVTQNEGGIWSEPFNLGRPVNTKAWESQPSLSADGVTLYFVSNRSDGFGGSDIWYSTRTEGGWSNPKNLGPEINTAGDEQFPFIHHDGKTLYFTSTGLPGMGKSDIFLTRLKNGRWSEPLNLGYPINTHGDEWNFIVNRTGNVAFFSSDGIAGSFGGMDIYSMDLYESARPNKTGYVKGIVYDIDTKQKLEANVELYNLESGELAVTTFSDKTTGAFLVTLPSNSNYAFEAQVEGYMFHSENFELTESTLENPYILEIGMKKIGSGKPMVLKNVFFNVDKWDLKEASKVELNIVAEFLRNNEKLFVEFGGHTDNTGGEEHNKLLSNNRARSVYNYLIENGISDDRLSYKGYGSSVPIADNNTEEGRALNRRTELKIIK